MFISIYRAFFHPTTAILNQILVKFKRLFGNFDPSIHFGVKHATAVLRGPGWLHSCPRLAGQSTQNEIVGKFAGIETNDNGFQ